MATTHSALWMAHPAVDPNDDDAVEQLEYNVLELGLQGLKVAPIYQHFNPQDPT